MLSSHGGVGPVRLFEFFSTAGFMPHGHCYLWNPSLVFLHLVSDSLIAVSYTTIPITLAYFVRKRNDLPFNFIFWCFVTFIVACGMTHYMEVWTLWRPDYWFSGGVKAVTAVASASTALLLVRVLPIAIKLPSHGDIVRAHEALSARETFYRTALESSLDGYLLLDAVRDGAGNIDDYRFLEANGAGVALLHALEDGPPTTRDELIGARVSARLPRQLAVVRRWCDPVTERGEARSGQVPVAFADGRARVLEARATPLGDGVALSVRDVTEQVTRDAAIRASLEEKEILLMEVHHRVKNNLQVISSLLNLQAERAAVPEIAEALRESQSRVMSIALVHERMYRSPDLSNIELGDYLEGLAAAIGGMFPHSAAVTIQTSVVRVTVPIDVAIPCGLIANELLTNAMKHAYPGGAAGSVRLHVRVHPDALELEVADDGIGFPEDAPPDARSSSLGLHLVYRLVEQLGGRLQVATRPGTRFQLRIPRESVWPMS
jgi:two-component sensor histidine kinase/PAS domain-containing protein